MPRKCTECGKMHGMVLEDTRTGEVEKEIEKCYDCLWKNWYPKILTEQIVLFGDDLSEKMTNRDEYETVR